MAYKTALPGYSIDPKTGKVVKRRRKMSVSQQIIERRGGKKSSVKVVRRTAV